MFDTLVFYDDGGVYSGEPSLAPKTGVVCVLDAKNNLQYQRDFYVLKDDPEHLWYGCDQFGLWDMLTQPGAHVVLFGRSIPDKDYKAVIDYAARVRHSRAMAAC